MKKRVGILTSGGDCPGLNATIRGVAKALYARMGDNVEIVGILNGYHGLINGEYKEMCEDDFRGILTLGGTILGTKRTPFKLMRVVEDDKIDKVAAMKKTYKDAKLDCLLCLGGNGTHKTANLLSQEGLNIIGLPKTIDNDIYGTDVTFGFHTAVDIATEVIDRIHTTAGSHSRADICAHHRDQGCNAHHSAGHHRIGEPEQSHSQGTEGSDDHCLHALADDKAGEHLMKRLKGVADCIPHPVRQIGPHDPVALGCQLFLGT